MTGDSTKNNRLVGLFLLGCVLFNYPVLSLFSIKKTLLDIPLFYLYIFTVWSGLIILLIIATQRSVVSDKPPAKKSK